jgi:hypothetical protein
MGQNIHGAEYPWGEILWVSGHEASCHGASCHGGEMSMRRVAMGRVVMGASCHEASCYGASCPGSNRTYSHQEHPDYIPVHGTYFHSGTRVTYLRRGLILHSTT